MMNLFSRTTTCNLLVLSLLCLQAKADVTTTTTTTPNPTDQPTPNPTDIPTISPQPTDVPTVSPQPSISSHPSHRPVAFDDGIEAHMDAYGAIYDSASSHPTVTGHVHKGCNFDTIVEECGPIQLHSIDDSVYGYRRLDEWTVNVINPVKAYADNLYDPNNLTVEGKDNPDVAISYAFMHYICFEYLILNGEEHKIYDCMREFCPRIENIESWCEGMNA